MTESREDTKTPTPPETVTATSAGVDLSEYIHMDHPLARYYIDVASACKSNEERERFLSCKIAEADEGIAKLEKEQKKKDHHWKDLQQRQLSRQHAEEQLASKLFPVIMNSPIPPFNCLP
jgi:hypothetical protein